MFKDNKTKMGLNNLINKFYVFNNQVKLSDINPSYTAYKTFVKVLFHSYKHVT